MHLDALSTYFDASTLAAGKRPSIVFHPIRRYNVRRTRKRSILLARYRRMLTFGFGEKLAKQWVKGALREDEATWTKRDEERIALRRELRPLLHAELQKLLPSERGRADERATYDEAIGHEPQPGASPDQDVLPTLRVFFQRIASMEAGSLLDSYSELELRRMKTGLTKTSLRLCTGWAALRLQWAQSEASAPEARWLPEAEEVKKALAPMRRVPRARRTWLDYYNAACTRAVGLLGVDSSSSSPDNENEELDDLAEHAVKDLEKFAGLADRVHIAHLRPWIVSEDPDLQGLRPSRHFQWFEARHFPASEPTPARPDDVHLRELMLFKTRLVRQTARRLEEIWHSRVGDDKGGANIHTVLRWWREEEDAWRYASLLAKGHNHWQSRIELVDAINVWCERYRRTRIVLGHPIWSEEARNPKVREIGVQAVDDRFQHLGQLIDERLKPLNAEWMKRFKMLDRDGLSVPPAEFAHLCDRRAALWDTLDESFAYEQLAEQAPEGGPLELFEQWIKKLERPSEDDDLNNVATAADGSAST